MLRSLLFLTTLLLAWPAAAADLAATRWRIAGCEAGNLASCLALVDHCAEGDDTACTEGARLLTERGLSAP